MKIINLPLICFGVASIVVFLLAGCTTYGNSPLPWEMGTVQGLDLQAKVVVHVNSQSETARLCNTAKAAEVCTIWREPSDPPGELHLGELVIPEGYDAAIYTYSMWDVFSHELSHVFFGGWHP